jgi:hypothetical protein
MERLVAFRGTEDMRELPLGIVWLSKDAVSWLRGVRGELHTASHLRKLGEDWVVLHSIPVGNRGSDIDHVVIGPAGVFTVNSKRLRDRRVWVDGERMLVDGRKADYLRNAEFEARRVDAVLHRAGLMTAALPIIAVSGAKSITVKASPSWKGRVIGVATVEQIVRRIRRRPVKLTPDQVALVARLFSDSSAWTGTAPSSNALDVRAAYDLIDRGVTRWNLFVGSVLLVVTTGGLFAAFTALDALTRL